MGGWVFGGLSWERLGWECVSLWEGVELGCVILSFGWR